MWDVSSLPHLACTGVRAEPHISQLRQMWATRPELENRQLWATHQAERFTPSTIKIDLLRFQRMTSTSRMLSRPRKNLTEE